MCSAVHSAPTNMYVFVNLSHMCLCDVSVFVVRTSICACECVCIWLCNALSLLPLDCYQCVSNKVSKSVKCFI